MREYRELPFLLEKFGSKIIFNLMAEFKILEYQDFKF